jgi:hypothetical protein
MNGINHGCGMGLGWFIGVIILVVANWLITTAMNQSNKPNLSN